MPQPNMDNDAVERAVIDYIAQDGDPYSAAVSVLVTALETAMQGQVNGGMSEDEYQTLTSAAMALVDSDPAVRINIEPQPGGED